MFKKIATFLIIVVMAVGTMVPQSVSANTYARSGYACKSGNYIYFAFSSSKKSTPIYKFNVDTGRRTTVFPRKASSLKEFRHLNVSGKYLYVACRKTKFLNCSHIYRINVNNGKAKFLVKGMKPTLIGDKLVYDGIQSVKVNDNSFTALRPSGKQYMIDKDSPKKKAKPVNHDFRDVETSCKGERIAYGKYQYYISSNGKKVYRVNGSKKKTIFKAKKITSFRALSGYLVVKTKKGKNNVAYCVKNNGSSKKKMLTW